MNEDLAKFRVCLQISTEWVQQEHLEVIKWQRPFRDFIVLRLTNKCCYCVTTVCVHVQDKTAKRPMIQCWARITLTSLHLKYTQQARHGKTSMSCLLIHLPHALFKVQRVTGVTRGQSKLIGPCPSLNFVLHVIDHNNGVQKPMLIAPNIWVPGVQIQLACYYPNCARDSSVIKRTKNEPWSCCRPSVFNLHMKSLLFHAQIQFL
jgi:hypothetical protein